MARLTEEELAMLTESERRALEELGEEYDADNEEPPMDPDDDPDDGVEASDESDPDDSGDDGEDDAAEADDDDPDADAADSDKPDDDQPDDDQPDADEADDPAPKDEPEPEIELPEDYEERLKGFDDKRAELDTDFDDGELTSQEYREKLAAINAEEIELREQVAKAQTAQEMQAQRQQKEWLDTVNAFLDDNQVYRQSRALHRELNDTVIEIAHSQEAAKMTGQQILEEAHKRVSSDPALAAVFKQDAPKKDDPKKDADGSKGKGKAKRRDVPPSLSKVPASDMTEADEGGRFASLDKLGGLELEAEMARLEKTNPRLLEEYLSR